MVQEVFACAWNTSLLIAESPASFIRQFSDFGVQLCVPHVRSIIQRSWDCHKYAPASITVTSAMTIARARKLSRSRTRFERCCSIFSSTGPTTFFKTRFPNHMFIMTNKRDQDDVPTLTSSAYDVINSAHSVTHLSISSRIFACLDSGLMSRNGLASSANSNASTIASSSVWTLSSR
jgi:hypothetical protein